MLSCSGSLPAKVNAKEFSCYLERDGGCVHCGEVATAVPHHRANRGMGGSKIRDVPSNIITMCHDMNNRMEADPRAASHARHYGWKLSTSSDPKRLPFWHAVRGQWLILDDSFGVIVSEAP